MIYVKYSLFPISLALETLDPPMKIKWFGSPVAPE
jgi:hypothetical protein